MFDLILTPMNLEAGQDRRELPGLFVAVPKKPVRLRAGDQLILLLQQDGSAALASNLLQELFARLSETYYASTGSVTAGMKAVAERLNDFYIARNTRASRQQSGQYVGLLTMAVVRGSTLSVAHAGTQHTYAVSGGKVEHFTDASGISRGLGLAKAVSLRFFQTSLEANAALILSSSAPARWSDSVLTAAVELDGSAAHRQLVTGCVDLQAGLVRIRPGKGQLRWDMPATAFHASEALTSGTAQAAPVAPAALADLEPAAMPAEAAQETEQQVEETADMPADAPETAPPGVYLSTESDRAPWEDPQPLELPAVQAVKTSAPEPLTAVQPVGRQARQRMSQEHAAAQAPVQPPPAAAAQKQSAPRQTARPNRPSAVSLVGPARWLAGLLAQTRKAWHGLTGGLSKLAARAMPDQPPEGLQVPASTMLFIALAVPVIVVAVAATVYAQRGRGELQQANIQAARRYVDQAAQREDLTLRRQDWTEAVDLLNKADSYGESAEATDLRQVIQRGVDELDGVARVSLRPAMNGNFGENVRITRMVALASDIYMLDANQGRILRIERQGQTAYRLDTAFACGPVNYGNVSVGKLLDISLLPPDNIAKASIMGIDNAGNLLFCGLTEKPAVVTLPEPDGPWGNISRMVYFQDELFVLDAVRNQIFRYPFADGKVDAGANIYFNDRIPKLDDVMDFAVDQEYIYLLHSDGTMAICSDASGKTLCDDPAPYGDARPGYEHTPLKFEGAAFSLMQASQPPDPSLYVLDVNNTAVYQLSLRKLNLQRQLRPDLRAGYPPAGKKASAFLITPNRRLMVVVDNQAYFGLLP